MTLRIVAEYADASNVFGDPATVRHKMQVLEMHCQEVGRDPKEILKSRLGEIIIARSEGALLKEMERFRPEALRDESARQRITVGTPEPCVEACQDLLEAGLDYLIFSFPDAYELESLQLFAEEVMPAFQ